MFEKSPPNNLLNLIYINIQIANITWVVKGSCIFLAPKVVYENEDF